MCRKWRAGAAGLAIALSLLPGLTGIAPAAASARGQFGLYQGSNNLTYAFGLTPRYAVQYYGWGLPLQVREVRAAWRSGTESFLELQTCEYPCDLATSVSLSAVAAGRYDGYLTGLARALAGLGHPVLMTFDHEMNGRWYPWDAVDGDVRTGVTPHLWKRAWDRVTSQIDSIAGKYVTWVWAPNVEVHASSFTPYWPGSPGGPGQDVGEQGLDGYLASPAASWANTFAPSVAAIRRLGASRYQLVIAETSVRPADCDAAEQIADLVRDARSATGSRGFLVYFDAHQWRLSGAMAAQFIADISVYSGS